MGLVAENAERAPFRSSSTRGNGSARNTRSCRRASVSSATLVRRRHAEQQFDNDTIDIGLEYEAPLGVIPRE